MSKQDRQGVRTAADLERKYNFSSMQKAIKNSIEGINKTNKTLDEYISIVLDVQSQIDGSVTTHFYSGVPTLENLPASEWLTEEDREAHLGDLYYDKNTGYVYKFEIVTGDYVWTQTASNEVIEAMAIANAAKDTADGKRRVFMVEPVPPYENGDLWLNELEIYVCQISKTADEAYEENDFILATKYTDDTKATQIGEELEVVRGTVTKIQENVDSYKIELETTTKTINEKQEETIESIERMAYAFGTEALIIEKEGAQTKTEISEDGMIVYKKNANQDDDKVLIANNEGVEAKNLHASTYLIVGKNSRLEDYDGGTRTGCFWIGN